MKFTIRAIDLFERDVRLRMPFRFGIVTLTEAPQAFARVRIRLLTGAEAEGGAAVTGPRAGIAGPDHEHHAPPCRV